MYLLCPGRWCGLQRSPGPTAPPAACLPTAPSTSTFAARSVGPVVRGASTLRNCAHVRSLTLFVWCARYPWVPGARAAASRGGAVRTRVLRLGHHHLGTLPEACGIVAVLFGQSWILRPYRRYTYAYSPPVGPQRLLYDERVVRAPRDANGQGCLGRGEIMIV